jgi:DUF2891 family protein
MNVRAFAPVALAVLGVAASATQQGPVDRGAARAGDLDAFYRSLPAAKTEALDAPMALMLTAMPLACLDRPQARPATRGYVWEATYRPVDDFARTRAFYGCYDWHSAVNSTWALLRALKMFPDMPTAPLIRQKLDRHLGASNITGETSFFKDSGQFEVPYGLSWVLKLQGELLSWDDADARKWAQNLQPLVALFSDRLVSYFTGLEKPVRTGVHPNSALAMNLMWDYLTIAKDDKLKTTIVDASKRYYASDKKCETAAEPGPTDFISPCLSEAAIMGRVLDPAAFAAWFDEFLPALYSPEFKPLTQPIDPALTTNPARLAAKSHLIGLAFMRAEEMNRVAAALPASDARAAALRRLSAMHAGQGMTAMHVAGYLGSHFLGAFSILYLLTLT